MPTTLTLTTADGAESWPLTVPTEWRDITLAQFVALHLPSDLSPAELLCGLPAGTLERLSVHGAMLLGNLLSFSQDVSPVLELLPPAGLADVGALPWGTLLLAQAHFESEPDWPSIAYGPRLLALYRMSVVHGKAEPEKVAACEAALLSVPITEVYGEIAFIIGGCKTWLSGTPPTQTKPLSQSKPSWRQALTRFLKRTVHFSRLTRRPAARS